MGAALSAFFSALLAKFVGMASWILALVVAMFAAWWLLGTDLGCWLFEQVLLLTVSILNGLNLDFSAFNPGAYVTAMPPELVQGLGLMRVPEAIAMILGSVVIRVTLQLIPFTRLGS